MGEKLAIVSTILGVSSIPLFGWIGVVLALPAAIYYTVKLVKELKK